MLYYTGDEKGFDRMGKWRQAMKSRDFMCAAWVGLCFALTSAVYLSWLHRLVTLAGKPLELSRKETELLFYLVRNRGIALTREKLISEIWGYDFYGDDRTLDTHIKLLRKSLGSYADRITTLRGVGYRFEKD